MDCFLTVALLTAGTLWLFAGYTARHAALILIGAFVRGQAVLIVLVATTLTIAFWATAATVQITGVWAFVTGAFTAILSRCTRAAASCPTFVLRRIAVQQE